MKHVPVGWTRGGGITIHTAPSPWLRDRDLVVVTPGPHHPTGEGAAKSFRFTDADTFEAWRRWWFDVPASPFPLDMLAEAAKQFTPEQWKRLNPPAPNAHRPSGIVAFSNPSGPDSWVRKALNPFNAPKPTATPTPAPNPFDRPKPKNPFDNR